MIRSLFKIPVAILQRIDGRVRRVDGGRQGRRLWEWSGQGMMIGKSSLLPPRDGGSKDGAMRTDRDVQEVKLAGSCC